MAARISERRVVMAGSVSVRCNTRVRLLQTGERR
jgi:hypothetical protein